MSIGKKRYWLIAYDIAEPRRLMKVHKCVKKVGVPIQYSVFLARMTHPEIKGLMEDLSAIIHPRSDDVRAYMIPESIQVDCLGQNPFPDGIMLLDGNDMDRFINGKPRRE